VNPSNQPLVTITSKEINVSAKTVPEAKLALKELKLKKKEIALQKKQVAAKMETIRAAYTDEVRRRGSMVRGGGWLGRMIRASQGAGRDVRRHQLASDLAPLEAQKQHLEYIASCIEQVMIQVEEFILKNS
jgi:hypothetical protein